MSDLETFCALLDVLGVEYFTKATPGAGVSAGSQHFKFQFSEADSSVRYGWVRPEHDGGSWTTYMLRPAPEGPVEDPSACSRGLMAYPPPWAVRMGF